MNNKKIILHLCAEIGSDSRFYDLDDNYEVIKIGIDIGVENYNPPDYVYGIIANPVCTEFSTVAGFNKIGDLGKGMFLVNHCLRIIEQAKPVFWILENPAKGRLKEILGKPSATYQPWQYGSSWSKHTALWGNFNMPKKIYSKWEDVPNKLDLWKRKDRNKPCLAYLHKSAKNIIPEFEWAKDLIQDDMSLRSMCSQGFARAFYEENQ
jgi:hypothetical protein